MLLVNSSTPGTLDQIDKQKKQEGAALSEFDDIVCPDHTYSTRRPAWLSNRPTNKWMKQRRTALKKEFDVIVRPDHIYNGQGPV